MEMLDLQAARSLLILTEAGEDTVEVLFPAKTPLRLIVLLPMPPDG
jgi:hypothetical protein